MNVASLTTLGVLTTTIQLRNTYLQGYATPIKHLHLIFFNELINILFLINHHCICRFWADRVNTFKWMKMKTQTSKSSKVRSKQKVCTPSTTFRWFPMMMMSELLRLGFKSGQFSQPWPWYLLCKNHLFFLCIHTSNLLRGLLSNGWKPFYQDQKTRNSPFLWILAKLLRIPKTKTTIVKPSQVQNF